jgi:hypothetical protein
MQNLRQSEHAMKKRKALKKPKKLTVAKPLRANFQPQPTPYHS